MRVMYAVLALAGCYGPHAVPGAPCDPVHPACPDDQSCVMINGDTYCEPPGVGMPIGADAAGDGAIPIDAPPIDVPPGVTDTDGDGVPDSTDNCPTIPNSGQANEDGDKFGDACDPCPPIADDNPADADGDGVADACDPHPGVAGDKIVLFEGFANGIPPTWVQTGGTWTAANGAVSTPAVQDGIALLTVIDPSASGHETIAASATLVDVTTESGVRAVGVVGDADPTVPAGVGCAAFTQNLAHKIELNDLQSGGPITSGGLNFAQGDTVGLDLRRDTMQLSCTVSAPMDQKTVMAQSLLATPAPQVGFRVHSAGATFQWLMVIAN